MLKSAKMNLSGGGLWLQQKRISGTKVELLAEGKWLMSAKYTCQPKIHKPKVALLLSGMMEGSSSQK